MYGGWQQAAFTSSNTRNSSDLSCIALHPPTADATAICKSERAVRQDWHEGSEAMEKIAEACTRRVAGPWPALCCSTPGLGLCSKLAEVSSGINNPIHTPLENHFSDPVIIVGSLLPWFLTIVAPLLATSERKATGPSKIFRPFFSLSTSDPSGRFLINRVPSFYFFGIFFNKPPDVDLVFSCIYV